MTTHEPATAPARLPPFWLLFAGCWTGYGLMMFLGALPYRTEPGQMSGRMLYVLCTVACSGPVWVFCHRLWERSWSWPRAMLATVALCYPLGLASTLFTNWVVLSRWQPKPAPFTEVLFSALSATSPFCALVVWGGLYFGLRQYERNARMETLARQAELRALRHQLTPHFLCNTLNGISTLVGEGRTQEARRMIARLGDFLRATLDGVGSLEVSLAQEVSYLEQYLAIEQARLGERLGVRIDIAPEALDASVPNLLLQPLVENAVQHGVVPFPAGGDVTVRAERRAPGSVHLTVRNRCRPAALSGEQPASGSRPANGNGHGGGLGLHNTAERLRVAYGAAASVDCHQDQEDARGWTATIELPYYPWSGEARKLPT